MARFHFALLVLPALAGCGLAQQAQRNAAEQEAQSAFAGAMAACTRETPTLDKSTIRRRIVCIQAAQNEFYRPYHPFPDLLDLEQAKMLALAAQMERGQITLEAATLEMAQINTATTAEAQRRNNASRSVAAQEGIAAGANRSTMCTRIGDSVICN